MSLQERTPVNIANSIRMKRSQHPLRAVLIVEGKDDKVFFDRYSARDACHIVVASGKPRVVEAILELDRTGFRGALGIVDADFEVLEGRELPSRNLVVTDCHDVECMALCSPALRHVLGALGEQEKIEAFQHAHGRTVIDYLLRIGETVGYLRWASARHKWSLKFEEMDFLRFVRERDLRFEEKSFFDEVRRHQGGRTERSGPVPSAQDMQTAMEALRNEEHDPWHVCCGHDLVELLSISLRKVLGKNNDAEVKRERLEMQLRLAYEESYFRSTRLYVKITQWESANTPFRVFQYSATSAPASG